VEIDGTSGADTLTGTSADDPIYGYGGADVLHGGAGNDTIYANTPGDSTGSGGVLYGDAGDDILYGNSNNELYGGNDNDTIHAGTGANTIDGGAGGNQLYGNTGNDTYVFSDGNDVIHESGGTDHILLPTGITADDLTFSRVVSSNPAYFTDLLIKVDDGAGGSIQIADQFAGGSEQVETVVFSDSSTLDITSLTSYATVLTSGNDTYSPGLNNDQILYGMDGNDDITTGTGNDVLDGGNGNDALQGGGGNDTYIASPGFDIISDTSGTDTINVPTGYSLSDVTFSRHIGTYGPDYDLIIDIHGLGEIRVEYQFYSSAYAVENLHFLGDSSTIALADQTIQTIGTSGNDYLAGITSGVAGNWFDGRGGNDYIAGGIGDNTYVFASSFGTNTISESYHTGNTNTLQFTGIDPADIRMWTDAYGALHLQDTTDPSHSITFNAATTGSGTSETAIGSYLEQITFDSSYSTTWDLTSGLTLHGDNSGDSLYGSASGDTITGGTGADYIYGNGGNDTLVSAGGNDNLYGGTGNDTYVLSSGFGNVNINESTSSGTDTIHFAGIDPANIRMWTDNYGYLHLQDTTDTSHSITVAAGVTGSGTSESAIGSYVEQVTFDSSYSTTWDLTGGIHITGDNSGDFLYGTAGADTITGGTGSDYLYGNGGNDILTGGGGTNYLYGGTGDDTYVFSSGFGNNSVNESTSSGTDTIHFAGIDPANIRMWTDNYGYLHLQDTTDTSHSITVYAGVTGGGTSESAIGSYVEQVTFDSSYSTTWDLTGGIHITGDNSGDFLYGTAGADTIIGGTGNDYLYGNGGDDVLYGAGGTDFLYGGSGADTFMLKAATALSSSTYIQDFSTGAGDKIDISDVIQNYDPAHDAIADWVQLTTSRGNTLLSVDTDGTGTGHSMVQIATISGVTGLDLATLISDHHLIVPT
jgi:Ca2+-binding RTX toxin-like protein